MGGPHTQTSAPSFVSSSTFERSTRLCSRSPTIATFSPAMPALVLADREGVEQRLRRVLVHAVAGVDDARAADARSRWQAPDEAWRITIMSGDIASRLSAVSTSVSPLTTLDVATAMFSVSALSRFSAISNEVRVRVLGSKNRLTTVLPRSVGTFLIGRGADLLHRLGGVEDEHDLLGRQVGDAEQVLLPQRVPAGVRRRGSSARASGLFAVDDDFVVAVDLLEPHLHALARARSAGSCRRSRP